MPPQLDVGFFPSDPKKPPSTLAKEALDEARRSLFDVLIVDTAGRLHVDEEMMARDPRRSAPRVARPKRCSSSTAWPGQDAVNAARAFGSALHLTGVVLTKTDGDARGGAALSVAADHRQAHPVHGYGREDRCAEPFHAERVASRILGMGDVLSLVENVTRNVDREQAEKLARKLKKGKDFDLEDLHDQLQQVEKMGGLSALMDKLPASSAARRPRRRRRTRRRSSARSPSSAP